MNNIETVIKNIIHICDICVINDGSTDSTDILLKKLQRQYDNLIVLNNQRNKNIQETIIKGFKYSIENNYDYVLTLDAGNSFLTKDIEKLIKTEKCDIVITNRVKKLNIPLYRKVLSLLARLSFNALYLCKQFQFLYIPDPSSGLRRYSKKVVYQLLQHRFHSKSFGFHIESLYLALISNKDIHLKCIPIDYIFTNSSFNSRGLIDAIKTLFYLIRF